MKCSILLMGNTVKWQGVTLILHIFIWILDSMVQNWNKQVLTAIPKAIMNCCISSSVIFGAKFSSLLVSFEVVGGLGKTWIDEVAGRILWADKSWESSFKTTWKSKTSIFRSAAAVVLGWCTRLYQTTSLPPTPTQSDSQQSLTPSYVLQLFSFPWLTTALPSGPSRRTYKT